MEAFLCNFCDKISRKLVYNALYPSLSVLLSLVYNLRKMELGLILLYTVLVMFGDGTSAGLVQGTIHIIRNDNASSEDCYGIRWAARSWVGTTILRFLARMKHLLQNGYIHDIVEVVDTPRYGRIRLNTRQGTCLIRGGHVDCEIDGTGTCEDVMMFLYLPRTHVILSMAGEYNHGPEVYNPNLLLSARDFGDRQLTSSLERFNLTCTGPCSPSSMQVFAIQATSCVTI